MAPNHLRGVAITGRMPQEYDSILTPEAISFVAHLARMYTPRVNELLNRWLSHASPTWAAAANLRNAQNLRDNCSRMRWQVDWAVACTDIKAHLMWRVLSCLQAEGGAGKAGQGREAALPARDPPHSRA